MSALNDVKVTTGGNCGNVGGRTKNLKNQNTNRSIKVTVSVDSSPNPGTFPQQEIHNLPAGGLIELGCSRVGGGASAPQTITYSVVGAEYI